MLKSFQVPVIASLSASYFVALFFVPIISQFLRTTGQSQEETDTSGIVYLTFKKIYRFRYLFSGIALILLAEIFFIVKDMEETDISRAKDPYITVNLKFNPEISETSRKRFFGLWEKRLMDGQEKLEAKFILSEFMTDGLSATFQVFPKSQGNKDGDLVLERLEERLGKLVLPYKEIYPGVTIEVGEGGGNFFAASKKQSFRFMGTKSSKLEHILKELKKRIARIKNVEKVNLEAEESGQPTYFFKPNPHALNKFHLSLDQISEQINSLMQEYTKDELTSGNEVMVAKIVLTPSGGTWDLEAFKKMRISTGEGSFIELAQLGTLHKKTVLTSVSRKNGVSSGQIYVYLKEGLSEEKKNATLDKVNRRIENYPYPKGFGMAKSSSHAQIENMRMKGNFVGLLSIFLIYLLMASLFESPLIPFAILFTVPLALLFGALGLSFMGMNLDPMARLGLIILVGIVVNNAIILIDVILKNREMGYQKGEAIIRGCASRFKAVSMTSATTIFGLLPVALGASKIMGIPYSSLGVVIISGMLFSTIITLVLLPTIYLIFDNIEEKIKNLLIKQSPKQDLSYL